MLIISVEIDTLMYSGWQAGSDASVPMTGFARTLRFEAALEAHRLPGAAAVDVGHVGKRLKATRQGHPFTRLEGVSASTAPTARTLAAARHARAALFEML